MPTSGHGEVPHMGQGQNVSYKIARMERTPCKRQLVCTQTDTTSETNMPTGQGYGYPPQIFTDPAYTVAMTCTDLEGEVKQETHFLGRYCEYCNRCGETCCWCFSSNWEEELNVDDPNSNPSLEMIPSPTVRRPPCRMVQN